MKRINILDCTLRDGGYINGWAFGRDAVLHIAQGLYAANLDMIEVGYLNKDVDDENKSIFRTIRAASEVLPKKNEKRCINIQSTDTISSKAWICLKELQKLPSNIRNDLMAADI